MSRARRGGSHSPYQKVVSGLLIFSILFSLTFRIPLDFFGGRAEAASAEYFNIVSVVVQEDIYSSVKSALDTYAKNVQKTLEKTKVVIIPAPASARPFDIASLLENLYFKGYKSVSSVSFESKLVGTVFVGNIPLPLASDSSNFSKTVLPYVDFADKAYVYNHKTENYERDSQVSKPEAEIWHGFVSPNTGDSTQDIQKINEYFQKNAQFYAGTGDYAQDKGVLSGDVATDIPEKYEPYVFYYDQFRENIAVDTVKYKGYQAYLDNIEDLSYHRYSKDLAERVKGYILGEQDVELKDLLLKLDPKFDTSKLAGPSTTGVGDISTRYITNNSVKNFLEVFNEATIGEFRKYVNNSGRYSGDSSAVNVDMPPFLITVLDLVSAQIIKNANTELENEIDRMVKTGLSRNIAIPTSITFDGYAGPGNGCGSSYINFLHGKDANTITNAKECSIYRGSLTNSGTLVESNRAFNVGNMEKDYLLVSKDAHKKDSPSKIGEILSQGYWGGNSPINLVSSEIAKGNFVPGPRDLSKAITPLYDPAGSKATEDSSKTPSPLMCFNNSLILASQEGLNGGWDLGFTCDLSYRIATAPGGRAGGWSARTVNQKLDFPETFEQFYKSFNGAPSCTARSLKLGDTVLKSFSNIDAYNSESGFGCQSSSTHVYNFKKISSYVEHKSPNIDDLKSQIQTTITPSLPIDKNRYVDFVGANGTYQKINYPYLFRVTTLKKNPTIKDYNEALKGVLDYTSDNISKVIKNANPSTLSGLDKTFYDLLKTGDYPADIVDLYKFIKDKPTKLYTLSGESKKMSYLDTLSFALYWKSLTSPTAKYKFIFENYLNDELSVSGDNLDFHLPKNKKQYEVAYLGAPGDAQSMYVKMDPEGKSANPYGDVIGANVNLNGYLFSSTISSTTPKDSNELFKCAPPDGVPIWQWIPAVVCRLKDMLPPKIKISEGVCSASLLSEDEVEELEACSYDANKNGINDCLEARLKDGEILLTSDASRYFYDSPGDLRASLLDKSGNIISYDNITEVNYRLKKIEVPKNATKIFDDSNAKEVYNYQTETKETRELISKYINFTQANIRANGGEAELLFSSKGYDANLYFDAFINVRDNKGNTVISLLSNPVKIQVRGDRLFAASSLIDNNNGTPDLQVAQDTVKVSEYTNIYVTDENKQETQSIYTTINNNSLAKEKLVFSLSNFTKGGAKLDIAYPVRVSLYSEDDTHPEQELVLSGADTANFKALFALKKSGRYLLDFEDADGFVYEKEFFVAPDVAIKGTLQLGATVSESRGAVTTNIITLLDRFENPANGSLYNISGSISGGALAFYENGEDTINLQTFEGYRAFQLKTNNKTGDNSLKFDVKGDAGTTLFSITGQQKVVDSIAYTITPVQSKVVVGGGRYDFKVALKDGAGNPLNTLKSRIYVSLDQTLGTPTKSYFDVTSGEAIVSINTKNVAKKGAILSFQLEGAKTIAKQKIDILPEKPIRLDYSLSRAKMEAADTETSTLKVELKDRYNNIVFTDNTTQIALEILDRYKTVVTSDTSLGSVKDGMANFTLKATPTPGVAYFKVSAVPNFDANKFTIEGQTPFSKADLVIAGMKSGGQLTGLGKKFFEETSATTYRFAFSTKNALTASADFAVLGQGLKDQLLAFWDANNGIVVKPVSVNAGKVETFYFWNGAKLEGKKYNALYTTLLGAPYGDITQKDYLAGSLIFNKNNRALTVTSLLNNPNKYQDILSLKENGLIDTTYSKADLSQNIEFLPTLDDIGRIKMTINNTSLNTVLGDVTFSFDTSSTYLDNCDTEDEDISQCTPSTEKSSILLKSLDTNYTASYVGNRLVLTSKSSDEVFSITKDGRVEKNVNIYLLYDQNSVKYPQFSLMTGEKKIGVLAFNYVDGKVIKTKDISFLANSLNAVKNSIGLYVSSSLYMYRDISDGKNTTHYISYQDPFASDFTLDTFTQNSLTGYENFYSEGGLGWQGQNKILLLLASGKSVGESTRAYQSFGLINIGDPVVMLKKIQKKLPGSSTDLRSFEQGVGDLVSKDTSIVAFKTFDYNKDSRKDILTLSSDGYFSLLENKKAHEPFKNLGHLAYVVDMKGRSVVETGNFTGDGYDDIFFVNSDGDPFLLNNVSKDFIRVPLKTQFNLEGKIMQVRSFDMDHDGKSDLVTLDDAGQIHIFYGGGTPTKPQFTKKLIGNGYGIELNSQPRNEGGLVYFEGLYQLPKPGDNSALLADNAAYLKKIQDNAADAYSDEQLLYDASFMDNVFFEEVSYNPEEDDINNIEFLPSEEDELEESLNESEEELASFLEDYDGYTDASDYYEANLYTTFVRSEYALGAGVDVKKVYTDLNGGTLKTGDKVKVDVTVSNVSSKKMLNVAYMESIPSPFIINYDTKISTPAGLKATKAPGGNYEFIVNNFDLAAGGSIKISYEVQTLPIKFGYILAGLYEKGEVGDDVWGDVIIKPNNKNCGDDIDIYRSVAERSYEKGKTKAECKNQPADPKTTDENKNGIPDYIEDLIGGNSDDTLNFAKEELEKLRQDSDADGIPNNEDDTPYFNDDTGLLNFGDGMGEKIEDISKQMDFFLKGFSCGFGGGSCIASPLNWAPLAPGNDPTFMGYPIGDGLHVGEGYPIFSFPTVPACPFCPPMWPISPYGAGGWLDGTPTGLGISQFRLFVTPTLTGGAGTAVCFGPNTGAWAFAPGLSPLLPGGQCVVAAMPLFGCKDDGSDGDITSKGPPTPGDFGIINGNCSDNEKNNTLSKTADGTIFDKDLIQDYITYKKTGTYPANFKDRLKKALSTVSTGRRYPGGTLFPRDALINLQGGGADDMSLSVDINPRELVKGNFSDVVKVQMKRVWPFPGFLMEWVTRQVEEIVTKLTDFPTLFIILPDFSGLMDDRWGNFTENVKKSWEKGQQNFDKAQERTNGLISSLRSQRPSDCTGANELRCADIDAKISRLQNGNVPSDIRNLMNQGRGGMSGVSEVYKFLSNLPLIAIEPQVVSISIPSIDASINRALVSRKMTLVQRQNEVAKYAIPLDCAAKELSPQACSDANSLRSKIHIDAGKLLSSLEKNIQAIEDYKNFPKKLANLLGKKEERLAQILCNIESISYLVGGWIGKNGKRFQAWVELFVLIKAVLKSWQVLIDIFTDYTASCHQCKNERHDLLNFVFKLINMIIPKIPVIQFPKWPDIILDLHNIRAGMVIYMPDFRFSKRPLILPNLPALILPDIPNLKIKLPALPVLPTIKLPELPDLPSLPRVTLPDLPPPPKLPKMFASLEIIADIMKLIAKAMCILKGSPFVPEWRAGDQIAFMTERSGYLSFDFLDLALPQFSYPFVDAIKVTTYVNLEFDNEFVVEMVRNILKPLNSFTNNFANSLNYSIPTLDFSDATPADINIKVTTDPKDPIKTGFAPTKQQLDDAGNAFAQHSAKFIAAQILSLTKALKDHKDAEVENTTFVELVSRSLASKTFTKDPRFEPIQKVWYEALHYDYSAEQKLVQELQDNNTQKFQTLHDIITTEIQETKNLKKSIDTLQDDSVIQKVASDSENRIEAYREKLEPFNEKFIQAAKNLVNPPREREKEIALAGENILSRVDTGLASFAKEVEEEGALPQATTLPAPTLVAPKVQKNAPVGPLLGSPLMAYAAGNKQLAATGGATGGVCTSDGKQYLYKGLYVVEKGISYRLFHYLDEVTGNEETINFDYDLDGDEDILYMMAGQVFVKENLKKKDSTKLFVTDNPLYLSSSTNKYFNGDVYYESVNGFKEGDVNDSFINAIFSAPKRDDISNFRLEFYQIVDKFTNLLSDTYEPVKLKKYIIDAIAGKEDATFVRDEEDYSVNKNLAYIENIGTLGGITMLTKEVRNLANDLQTSDVAVNLTSGTPLYAGSTKFTLEYRENEGDEVKSVTVDRYQNIRFKNTVRVSRLLGNAYIMTEKNMVVTGPDIDKFAYLPMAIGTKIYISDETRNFDVLSHLEVHYYDDSRLKIDWRDVKSYYLYDLGRKAETYLIRQELQNDFYYAVIRMFQNGIEGNLSKQILLAPQKEADTRKPDITLDNAIRIPVYQKKLFDFTSYIYEEAGVKNIQDFYIDFDLEDDADKDGNPTNDRTTDKIKINKTYNQVSAEFGPYDTLFTKMIGVHAIDKNNNHGYKEVPFEVYPPIPTINGNNNSKINGYIDETLKEEPVNIYRLRGGILTKLLDTSGQQKVPTGSGGLYNFTAKTATGVVLKYNDGVMGKIDEFTGKITLQNPAVNIKVYPSGIPTNDKGFPKISLLLNGEEIYFEYLTFAKQKSVEVVEEFDGIKDVGMYLRFTGDEGGYNTYKIPLTAPINPGATVVYSIKKGRNVPLFTILQDGRIYTAGANTYKLEYANYGNTVMYRLVDNDAEREVATLLMKVDGNFIIQ